MGADLATLFSVVGGDSKNSLTGEQLVGDCLALVEGSHMSLLSCRMGKCVGWFVQSFSLADKNRTFAAFNCNSIYKAEPGFHRSGAIDFISPFR